MMSKSILGGLAWAGTIIVSSLLLKIAQGNHVISADTATRCIMVMIGLSMATNANFMTKDPARLGPTERGGRLQTARRVTAWLLFIAGLIFAAAWALAPYPLDLFLSVGAVGAAAVGSVGYAIWAGRRRA